MANEAGGMKLPGNFRKLIDLLKSEPTYAPPNPKITTAAMETQYAAASRLSRLIVRMSTS
jgi:hypothetical protein